MAGQCSFPFLRNCSEVKGEMVVAVFMAPCGGSFLAATCWLGE